MNEIAPIKAQLRSKILAERKLRLSVQQDNDLLGSNLNELVVRHSPKCVATYLSFGTEPSTASFIESLIESGIEVLVPKVSSENELDWFVYDGKSQVSSDYGMPEPDAQVLSSAPLRNADLLVIPSLAVDRLGNRLGRGKGYFDKALAAPEIRNVYAICFESEFLDAIPAEAHDRRVAGVVTERGIHELN